MNNEISLMQKILTLFLRIAKLFSFSRWILGKDPDNISGLLSRIKQTRFVNYHTLIECYLIMWFLFEILIIISFPSGRLCDPVVGIIIAILAAIRLIELFGAQLYIITYRREKDVKLSARKILLGLMCYVEGMLIFCLIYMGLYTGLKGTIFSLRNGLSISSLSILYFSVANYTTTGFGDITALHPIAIIISSLESIFGLLFLAFFISGLVARAFSVGELEIRNP